MLLLILFDMVSSRIDILLSVSLLSVLPFGVAGIEGALDPWSDIFGGGGVKNPRISCLFFF